MVSSFLFSLRLFVCSKKKNLFLARVRERDCCFFFGKFFLLLSSPFTSLRSRGKKKENFSWIPERAEQGKKLLFLSLSLSLFRERRALNTRRVGSRHGLRAESKEREREREREREVVKKRRSGKGKRERESRSKGPNRKSPLEKTTPFVSLV